MKHMTLIIVIDLLCVPKLVNGSCVSTFRLGSRVLQPETFEMRQ